MCSVDAFVTGLLLGLLGGWCGARVFSYSWTGLVGCCVARGAERYECGADDERSYKGLEDDE